MSPPTSLEAAIVAAEAARPHTGRTVSASLTPQPATIDLGGTLARPLASAIAANVPAPSPPPLPVQPPAALLDRAADTVDLQLRTQRETSVALAVAWDP
jgi:hypothetical protein